DAMKDLFNRSINSCNNETPKAECFTGRMYSAFTASGSLDDRNMTGDDLWSNKVGEFITDKAFMFTSK
ncbi:unnamed protein product, partial [Rotaria socialis]